MHNTLTYARTHTHKYVFHCRIHMAKVCKVQYCSWLFQKRKTYFTIFRCALTLILCCDDGVFITRPRSIDYVPRSVCVFFFIHYRVFVCCILCARRFWCVWMSVYIMHGIIHGIPSMSTVCVSVCIWAILIFFITIWFFVINVEFYMCLVITFIGLIWLCLRLQYFTDQ